jgi:thymidylate synthase (FAD)
MINLVNKYFPVLDQGFIALKEVMGDDASIEQAARVSYGKGTRKISDTRNLLRYLMRLNHSSPYEMVELKFHIRMPMDCHRQHVRHRTASLNEYSTRYSEAIDACQQTDPKEWRLQAKSNKQGSAGFLTDWPEKEVTEQVFEMPSLSEVNDTPGEFLSSQEKQFHNIARNIYNNRLKLGVAKEQARKDLPLSNYTEMYWKIDLHNLFHYLKLRCDSHAQLEIRQYANIMAGIVRVCFPIAFEAWYDYKYQAFNFTRLDRELLVHCLKHSLILGDAVNHPNLEAIKTHASNIGMSDRELDEFWNKINAPKFQNFGLDLSKAKTWEELNGQTNQS